MAIDPVWIWIAVGAVALLVVVGLFARGARRSRTDSLRQKFGSEYEHAVKEKGTRKGERELATRAEEVSQYEIRPLSTAESDRFRSDWARVEQHFLDRPAMAVVEADEMLAHIMRTQGYPMGDFEKHAAALSVTHPRVVHHYRAAHKVMSGPAGSASTEDLRQAMLHYRTLFDELVRPGQDDLPADVPRANEVPMRPIDAPREEFFREEERRR